MSTYSINFINNHGNMNLIVKIRENTKRDGKHHIHIFKLDNSSEPKIVASKLADLIKERRILASEAVRIFEDIHALMTQDFSGMFNIIL